MDIHTIVVSELSFALLYAAIMLVYRLTYRQLQPGLTGSDCFIGSHVCYALALVLALVPGLMAHRLAAGLYVLLFLVAHLLLHRGFAELLEEGHTLWRSQVGLTLAGMALWGYGVSTSNADHASTVMWLLWGAQFALMAAMLLRQFEARGQTARWLAGGTTGIYALCHLIWFSLSLQPGGMGTRRLLFALPLIAHGAITFAFLGVASSRLNLRLVREAEVDELTGLMNRRAIRRAAEAALSRCRRRGGSVAVLMIDVDGLKRVNDGLGHGAGDALLCAVANALRGTLREEDMVARMGGDEFCVLLPGADELEAGWVADRCRRTIQRVQVPLYEELPPVSASFGVAHSEGCAAGWDDLLRRSDEAMYEAKNEGGNSVVVAQRERRGPLLEMEEDGLQRVG